jgi:hypothetical protein
MEQEKDTIITLKVTVEEANTILANNQQEYLVTMLDRFSVNKDTDATEGRSWQSVDLDTEPNNTDVDYQVFDVVNGYYTHATGLDNAKVLLANKKQTFLDWSVALSYFETWPTLPTQPTSIGTQEF